MDVINQEINEEYAIYLGDCVEVMAKLKKESTHLSIYSPPFGGLYHYSSSERDLFTVKTIKNFLIIINMLWI